MMLRRRRGLAVLLWVCAVCVGIASGLFAEGPGDAGASADLAKRLESLCREIAKERKALEAAREARRGRIAEAEARRRRLAEAIVEAELSRAELSKRRDALRAEVDRRRAGLEGLAGAATRLEVEANAAEERLEVLLSEMPIEADADDGSETPSDESADTGAVSFDRLTERLRGLHRDAVAMRVRAAEVWTAAGRLDKVDLLNVGLVGFAYRTTDGRIGLALDSPRDASGYRWREDLPPPVHRQLAEAFDVLASPGGESATLLDVPVDVTGRMMADARLAAPTLSDRLKAGGLVMIPLAVVTLLALMLIVERLVVLHRAAAGRRLADKALEACRRGDFETADRLVDSSPGSVPRVLAGGLRRRDDGAAAMEDGIQERLLHESPRLERRLGSLAVLAAAAPLLGLLGTVTGIIRTFSALQAAGRSDLSLMAGGISEALVTTAAGLAIAIPVLLIHGYLRSRADALLGRAEKHASTLLTLLVHDRS